jgi:hypothetical protein
MYILSFIVDIDKNLLNKEKLVLNLDLIHLGLNCMLIFLDNRAKRNQYKY